MAPPTPRLGLARPEDEDTDWGGEYRATMEILDANPGIAVIDAVGSLPSDPWVGQQVYVEEEGQFMGWTGEDWETVGMGGVDSASTRFEWTVVSGETVPLYVGKADPGTDPEDNEWTIRKFWWSAVGAEIVPTKIGVVENASWINRTGYMYD